MTQTPSSNSDWKLFRGSGEPRKIKPEDWPASPPWRNFPQEKRGETFQVNDDAIEMVNAALYLRRPLLITGNPGTGKSSLAYAVARELGLEPVLKWPITTRTTLKDGLYGYDAIGRLQDAQKDAQTSKDEDAQSSKKDNREKIGDYITLGPLGTAFLPVDRPRVLLIDEIDKSDIDLPNDLLNLFEDGEFPIPELQRIETSSVEVRTADRTEGNQSKASILNGLVRCQEFPLVIMTSNNERDFPPPFLRRCLRYDMPTPKESCELERIVTAHLGEDITAESTDLIERFLKDSKKGIVAVDQLLNAVYLVTMDKLPNEAEQKRLKDALLKSLGSNDGL
jgi:MoxR-like ATPase